MAEQVEKKAAAALLEKVLTATTPTSKEAAASGSKDDDVDSRVKKQSNNKAVDGGDHRRSPLVARVGQKLRMLLMAFLLPSLMPVSKVCHWALSISFHMLSWSFINVRPMVERRLRRMAPAQAAVARVLPTAMTWCGAAGMAAAALALLLGGRRRRDRLALAYAALAATAANHCLWARIAVIVLIDDDTAGMGALAVSAALILLGFVFFAAEDLAGFRSLRKAAAEDDDAAQAQPKKEN
ncbi:unnamed protein product [Urochloa humidicola]